MLSSLRSFLTFVLRRQHAETEMEEELHAHLRNRADDLEQQGLPRAEAERQARIEFGGYQRYKEECREALGTRLLEELLADLRFGLRQLRRNPGFTAVAIVTLALGIGANTAIFSLMNGVVLRDLPVPHPEELAFFGVHDRENIDTSSLWLSLPMFQEFRRDQTAFSSAAVCWCDAGMRVETDSAVSLAEVSAVSGDFFSTLGARPELGRLIRPEDVDLKTYVPKYVAVLGYAFWQSHYGGSKDIVGKTVKVDRVPFTVIGVTEKGFRAIHPSIREDVMVPLTAEPVINGGKDVRRHLLRGDVLWLSALGRLRPGVRLARAQAQLESLWPLVREAVRAPQQTPLERANFDALRFAAVSGARGDRFLTTRFAKPLCILLAISGLVLLAACVNLASLMLARGASRSHEMAVRAALGASGSRLARQVLTESLVLSIGGALAGFGFANCAGQALSSFILSRTFLVPGSLNLSPDWRILGFTAALAILTGISCGFASAWRAAQENPNGALQEGARTVSGGTGRLGQGLVIAQVALSLVLLSACGLFIRSLEKLSVVDPGFRTHNLLDVSLWPRHRGLKSVNVASYYRELTNRVSHLPGVRSAGLADLGLGGGDEWRETLRITGTGQVITADLAQVMPGFFRTAGIQLLRGRRFTWHDDDHAPRIAVVSEGFTRKFFPAAGAIGQQLTITSQSKWKTVEIVGIASDASLYDIRKHAPPTVYVPEVQYAGSADYSALYIHTDLGPVAIANEVRRTVRLLGHQYVWRIHTISQDINGSLLRERVTAMLSAFFGVLALLIAGIGLYGLTAYNVSRRTHEIGIRVTLGARPGAIQRMVLRESLILVAAGIAIGMPCALAATRLVGHMLYGLTPDDPVTMAAAGASLVGAGLLSAFTPARRATKVDPMVALRHE